MFRSVFLATVAASCAGAATISTVANCNGQVVAGGPSAACSNSVSIAQAQIGASLQYQDSVGFSVRVDGGTFSLPPPFTSFSASASFQDDYTLMVTGGSGSGTLIPCIFASWDNYRGSGQGFITFGSTGLGTQGGARFGSIASCEGPPIPSIPFTFGVPQVITVSMNASASGGTSSQLADMANLNGFQFFDAAGAQLSNVHFTLVSTAVPEPGTLALLCGGLAMMFWKHKAGRDHRSS